MLKCPIDGTKSLKLSQMVNGTSADAAMRCPRTRMLRQRRVDQTKQNWMKKTASEKESLTRSRKTMTKIFAVLWKTQSSLLDVRGNVSDKTIQIDNRKTVSSKASNEDRLVLLAMQIAEDQKSDEFRDRKSKPGSSQIEELGKHSQLVETRSNRSSVISKTSGARRVLFLKLKALKEQEKFKPDWKNWNEKQKKRR